MAGLTRHGAPRAWTRTRTFSRAAKPCPETASGRRRSNRSEGNACENAKVANKLQAMQDLVKFGLTEGQKDAEALGYIPLPPEIVAKATGAIQNLTSQ